MRKLIKVTEQTLWQVIGRIITSATAFIALGLITRNYDKIEVGAYTLAQTYLGMFIVVVDLGLNAYVLTKLSDPTQANKLFNIRFYWSLILAIFALLLALVLPLGSDLFKMAVLYGFLTLVGNSIFNSANLIFQKELKYQISIIASTMGSVAMVVALALLVYFKAPIYSLVICYSLGWMVNNLFSLNLVKKYYNFKLTKPDLSYGLDLIKNAWPISATLVLNVVYFRFDAFILAGTKGLADTAIYNLSYSLFQTALFLPTFIMNSYYPIILKELTEKKLLFKQLKIAFGLMLVLALTGSLVTFLISTPLVNLITGGGFEDSVKSINILALSFPAFFGSALLMWVFVSLKLYKPLMWIYLAGLIVNVLLNLVFTPMYSFIATSWITVISEYLILILQLMVLYFRK